MEVFKLPLKPIFFNIGFNERLREENKRGGKSEYMKDRKIIFTIICLIIIVILLYFLIRHLGLINLKIPTGNVNIFDINFIEQGESNTTNDIGSLENLNGNYENSNNLNLYLTQNKDNQQNRLSENLAVYDNQTVYENSTPLKIFENKSYYVKNDLIAPESENSYQFIIRNNNDFAIRYSLGFKEDNQYNINMKYRLKQDGKYIIGDDNNWVTASDLIQEGVALANYSYNVYTLDWKWFESDDKTDTKIGTNIEANYGLQINIFASRY